MITSIKNFKIINQIYKSNLTQLSGVKGVKSLSVLPHQEISKFLIRKNTNKTFFGPVKTNFNLGNFEQFVQIRGFANFSPKPAESEDNLKKKTSNEEDEDKNNKQMPDHGHDGRTLPRLMDFPETMWPSMFNSIKNWIMIQFIIRPYMDREFNIRDFCQGAKKAMQVVSSKLMKGDFTSLHNLVTPEALTELKPVVQKLSVSQRRQLEVKESDIYLTFPYQVGIIFDETNEEAQKRKVEITMVFHVLRGLKEMRESGEEIPWNMGILPEYQDRVFVCNYRLIKEFTKGQESDWIINVVNHFKPIDLINELKKE